MDFNNPKVRQAILEHIAFATSAVASVFPDVSPAELSEDKIENAMAKALRNPIIMQVLQFTLSLDYRLRNSLLYNQVDSLEDEPQRSERNGLPEKD